MTTATLIDNPFPGLRSFEPEQADLFFGRDEQIEGLTDRLHEHRFVAVVGTSGSGKSSLVRAGLIPALQRRYLGIATRPWCLAIFRPGMNPNVKLAEALSSAIEGVQPETVLPTLRSSSAGLARFAHQSLDPGENLLIVVDQFEELFRYREESAGEKTEDATAFVKLLLAASGHSDHPLPGFDHLPVYVVITMRSDFLGKCSLFGGLPEALNESQYLVPRMTREQQHEVIEGPIGMAGASIEPSLVQRLLNDAGDNPDHLPVLQHVLMRTWVESSRDRERGEAIRVAHYEAVGGMSEALDRDANLAFEALRGDAELETITRTLFQRLVDPGAPDEETRRPTPLSEIVAVTAAPEANVTDVINLFRERGFITVSGDDDPVIDITHESLIRNWTKLNNWAQEEARSAANYRRLAETSERYAKKEVGLLDDPELQSTLNWREENHPNQAWAHRYHSGFAEAMYFLDGSNQARWDAIDRKEQERRKELWRTRSIAVALGVLLLLAVGAFVVARKQRITAQLERTTAQFERDKSRRLLYDANIYFGQRAATEGQFLRAIGLLDELLDPGFVDLRGFEWFHLWRVAHVGEAVLSGHSGAVNALAFSPDGKILATAAADGTVKLWDQALRKELVNLRGPSHAIYSVAFSRDGKILAYSGLEGTVELWDTASREGLATLWGHSRAIFSIAFSPGGKTLASGSADGTVKLWNLSSYQEIATFTGHSGNVNSVAFSPDGNSLASANSDGTVKLWDVASGKELATLKAHSSPVSSIAFSPDARTIASASSDKTVKLWEVASRRLLATLKGQSFDLSVVAFSPNGKILASSGVGNTVKLWDVASRQETGTLSGHSGHVYSIAFSPDGGALASGSGDSTVRLWAMSSRRESMVLVSHAQPVACVAFSPDGKVHATSSWDHTVKVWDTASSKVLTTLRGHSDVVNYVRFSPDGKIFATASADQTVKLWDTALYQMLATLSGHTASILTVAFSPDGKILATGSSDESVRLWDTASYKELAALTGHLGPVNSLAFSPDGTTLATVSDDKAVKLWDIASRVELATLTGHSGFVVSVAFSPDGKTFATGSQDNTAKLWDTVSRKELATLRGHSDYVQEVVFSPDGKTLATGSADGNLKLWDIASHKELITLEESSAVTAVAFSPDGKTLAGGTSDGLVKFWFAARDDEVNERRKRGY